MAASHRGGILPQGETLACTTSTNRHETPLQQETQLDEHEVDDSIDVTSPTSPSWDQDTKLVVETQESQYKARLADAEQNVRTLTKELEKVNKSSHSSKYTSWFLQLGARESSEMHKMKTDLEKMVVLLDERDRELRRQEANQKKCETLLEEKDRDCRQALKKLETIVSEKDREIRLLVTKYKNIEASERGAMNGVEQLKRENFELGKQLKSFAEELRRTQERSIRDMTDGRWVPPPDESVRHRLRRLDRDVRDWAKRWVGPPLRLDSLSPEVRRDFVDNYLCRVVPRINGRPPLSITSPKPWMEDRILLLLLMAVLADEIMECFFDSPFFCFDEDSRQVLATTYHELSQASPRESHIWGSAMIRIMNPPPRRDQSPNEAEALKLSEHRVRRICNRTSAKFTKGHPKLLLKTLAGQPDAEAERAKSLANIMMSAAGIATSLWAQRPYLRWHRIEQLKLVPFSTKSPIMEPHPMHRIDEDDASHNGRKVGIVIRPSLWAPSEDDLGFEDETKSRVLAKAVVWLED